jgi:hypothetical protein
MVWLTGRVYRQPSHLNIFNRSLFRYSLRLRDESV